MEATAEYDSLSHKGSNKANSSDRTEESGLGYDTTAKIESHLTQQRLCLKKVSGV